MNKEIEAFSSIMNIKEMIFDEVRTVFENEGLNSTEIMIIYNLQHKHKEMKSGDLAAALFIPMSTLTGIIDKMIEKGIVIRKHSETDRRVVIIELNPEFKERSEHCMDDLTRLLKDISGTFTQEWFDEFNNNLKIFKKALEKRARQYG
ncbi:MAG: MarR family winged helix-turn-helix transcriptional regulator [Clostridiaceae bacterium]